MSSPNMIDQYIFIHLEIRFGIWLDLANGMHMLMMLLPDTVLEHSSNWQGFVVVYLFGLIFLILGFSV